MRWREGAELCLPRFALARGTTRLPTMFTIAHLAYLDPNTGSLILQGLIAGLFAFLFILKTCWQSIKAFVLRLLGRAPAAESDASTGDTTGATPTASNAPRRNDADDDNKGSGVVS